jgi:hypothetical protein
MDFYAWLEPGDTMDSGSTPEPNSILLFGAGALAIVGRLRRKFF